MTLRELLRNLVADETARQRFEHDPAATLQEHGFEAIDPPLLGTALVHYADSADASEFDRLQALLDRYGPLADVDVAAAVDPEPEPGLEPESNLLDLELDVTASIDDLEVEPDEPPSKTAAEGPGAEAPPSFGSGSNESTSGADREGASETAAPTLGADLADRSFVPNPSTDPAVLDDIVLDDIVPAFELDVPDDAPATPPEFDDLDG